MPNFKYNICLVEWWTTFMHKLLFYFFFHILKMFKSYLRAFEIKNQKCQGGLASNICYWIESTTIHWARTTHTNFIHLTCDTIWAKIIMRLHKTFHKIMHHNLTKKSPKFQSFNDDEFSKNCTGIVEKILKGSLDLIPSPSVKIQIMDGKVCLRCKGNHC